MADPPWGPTCPLGDDGSPCGLAGPLGGGRCSLGLMDPSRSPSGLRDPFGAGGSPWGPLRAAKSPSDPRVPSGLVSQSQVTPVTSSPLSPHPPRAGWRILLGRPNPGICCPQLVLPQPQWARPTRETGNGEAGELLEAESSLARSGSPVWNLFQTGMLGTVLGTCGDTEVFPSLLRNVGPAQFGAPSVRSKPDRER